MNETTIEKRNCDYYEKLDTDRLEKVAQLIDYEITVKQLETKILAHNLKNILFVLKSREISSEDKNEWKQTSFI